MDRELIYNVDLEESVGSGTMIDDANGILKGVTILTGNKTSLNKTNYTDKAMHEARARYEGAKMFLDHPAKGETNRSIHDFGGVYKNLRIEENRLKGDLHLLESKRQMLVGIAKMRPAGVGLSIKDRGYGVEKDGVFYVEGFTEGASYSVDFVSEASVNKDLYESRNDQKNEEDTMDWKALTAESLRKERPDLIESITAEATSGLVKELNEAKAGSKEAAKVLEKANKTLALAEAAFDKDVLEAVRKMINPESVSLETAKDIINGQKNLLEALAKRPGDGKPAVKGMGAKKEKEIEEGTDGKSDLTDLDHVADAFKS